MKRGKIKESGYSQHSREHLLRMGKLVAVIVLLGLCFFVYLDFRIREEPSLSLTRIPAFLCFFVFLAGSLRAKQKNRAFWLIPLYYMGLFLLQCMGYLVAALSWNADLIYLMPASLLLLTITVFLAMRGTPLLLVGIYFIPGLAFLLFAFMQGDPYSKMQPFFLNVLAAAGFTVMYFYNESLRKEAFLKEQGVLRGEERYQTILAVSNTSAWEYHRSNDYLWCSREYFGMLGYTEENFPMYQSGRIVDAWNALLHPDDREMAIQRFEQYLTEGSPGMYENTFRLRHADGGWIWILSRGRTLFNPDGTLSDLTVGTHMNITQRKEMEHQLFTEKEQFKTTLLSVGDAVISTDTKGNVAVMNTIAEKLTGWRQEDAVGKPMEEVFLIVNEFSGNKCENPVLKVLNTGLTAELAENTLLLSSDGGECPIEDSAAPIKDEQGNITGVVLVFRDCTARKKSQEEIEYLSFHDHLTGLYNRRFFEMEMKRLDTADNYPLALIMGDVNGLKLINDSFGHAVGDQLLLKAAEALRAVRRDEDSISRIGGDEYVILMPGTSEKEVEKQLAKVKSLLGKESVAGVEVSVSFGYDIKVAETEDLNLVLKTAEDRMYHNKLFEGPSIRGRAIDNIVKALNNKSKREEAHSQRVSELCAKMGEVLDLGEYKVKELKAFGLLHDIGKIAIPDSILNKPGQLTESEWMEMKCHAETGYRILSTASDMSEIAEYVLAHHERWDGSGYPKGIKGEEIPLESRICSIADAYDAMTSQRSYHLPVNQSLAREELKKHSGTQFDPELIKVFLGKVLKEIGVAKK